MSSLTRTKKLKIKNIVVDKFEKFVDKKIKCFFFLILQSLMTWSKRLYFKQFLFFTWMTYFFLIHRYNCDFLSSMFFFEIVVVVVFIFFIVFRFFIEFEVFDIMIWSFWFFFIFFYHVCFDNILHFQVVVLLFSNFVD